MTNRNVVGPGQKSRFLVLSADQKERGLWGRELNMSDKESRSTPKLMCNKKLYFLFFFVFFFFIVLF